MTRPPNEAERQLIDVALRLWVLDRSGDTKRDGLRFEVALKQAADLLLQVRRSSALMPRLDATNERQPVLTFDLTRGFLVEDHADKEQDETEWPERIQPTQQRKT
jgi:hypothetical protein